MIQFRDFRMEEKFVKINHHKNVHIDILYIVFAYSPVLQFVKINCGKIVHDDKNTKIKNGFTVTVTR